MKRFCCVLILSVFGAILLQNTAVKAVDLPVYFRQNQGWWASEGLGESCCGDTISQSGCAVTSLAMLMRYYNVSRDPNGNNVDPGTLNSYLRNHGGFSCCDIDWYAQAIRDFSGGAVYLEAWLADYYGDSVADMKARIDSELNYQNPVIIGVGSYGSWHKVVAIGKSGNTYNIADPIGWCSTLDCSSYGNAISAVWVYNGPVPNDDCPHADCYPLYSCPYRIGQCSSYAERFCECYYRYSGRPSEIGCPTSDTHWRVGFVFQNYDVGFIVHDEIRDNNNGGVTVPAMWVHGGISERYDNDQVIDWIGAPTTEEFDALPSEFGTHGRVQRFEVLPCGAQCSIYWMASGNHAGEAYIVRGGIAEKYECDTGRLFDGRCGTTSPLGFPLSDEFTGERAFWHMGRRDGTPCQLQKFEVGSIYWWADGSNLCYIVRGGIEEMYECILGSGGPMGLPISDEAPYGENAYGRPRYQRQIFQGGIILWDSTTGHCEAIGYDPYYYYTRSEDYGSYTSGFGTPSSVLRHPLGTLVKPVNSNTVYLISLISGVYKRCAFGSSYGADIFESYNFRWSSVITTSQTEISLYASGPQMKYPGGTLFEYNGTVFVLSDGKLRAFNSAATFEGLGYSWSKVKHVSKSVINQYPRGSAITSTRTHPNEAVVRNQSTGAIALIQSGKKRIFSTMNIYLSHYSNDDYINISNTEWNRYPTGSQMRLRDGTLVKKNGSDTVYVIESSKRRAFSSWQRFVLFGYSSSNIITVTSTELNLHPSGPQM